MKPYKHIVIGIELVPESDNAVIQKALALLADTKAKVTLVHAVEHLINLDASYSVPAGINVQEELLYSAKEALSLIAKKLSVDMKQQVLEAGSAKHLIIDTAKAVGADLIIVGSHGRHGIHLLLGSTANAVIHAAHCDVLAVRVKDA